MTYGEIIEQNCSLYFPEWWPRYAYHFTDVTNAISILSCGMLYSRSKATQRGVMENDNASKQVIDITDTRTTSFVRFYFRPMTPTQYHNEGYKHIDLRYNGDINANVPVPVFFVFDLESVLKTRDVVFSPLSQAGNGNPVYQGETEFEKMPFNKIYSNGPCDEETRRFRHAEILCPDSYAIDDSLRVIACRNECEKTTFLNMLAENNTIAYYKYKDKIRVARYNVFYRNGLYVESVNYHNNTIAFEFASTPEKKDYETRKRVTNLLPITARYMFQWINKQGRILYSTVIDQDIDYINPQTTTIKLPHIIGAFLLRVILSIDGKIICIYKQSVNSYELV